MRFKVRLFAEGGDTVVEQFFRMEVLALGLWYEDDPESPGTTVNGQDVPVPNSLFGGDVTFQMVPPWIAEASDEASRFNLMTDDFEFEAALQLLGSRSITTGCQEGPAPTDAEALARTIRSNPDLEATDPVPVTIGGLPALQMDVTTELANTCRPGDEAPLVAEGAIFRPIQIRLYLVDLPEGSADRILAVAFMARKESFERVLEVAAPIVESVEIHAP